MKKTLISITVSFILLSMTSCGIDVPFIPFVENESPIKSQPNEYISLNNSTQKNLNPSS